MSSSFYCGDAAGREENWAPKKKKDHSSVDRLLALNLGLKFYTPEEYFLGHRPVPHRQPAFLPHSLEAKKPLLDPPDAPLYEKTQEVTFHIYNCHLFLFFLKNQYSIVTFFSDYSHDWLPRIRKKSIFYGTCTQIELPNNQPRCAGLMAKVCSSYGKSSRCWQIGID